MLLHNSVPHEHEDDFEQLQLKRTELNCCLAYWFKSVLQLDFGQEHLEVFNEVGHLSFDDISKVDHGINDGYVWLTKNQLYKSGEFEIQYISTFPIKEIYNKTLADRGPPFNS